MCAEHLMQRLDILNSSGREFSNQLISRVSGKTVNMRFLLSVSSQMLPLLYCEQCSLGLAIAFSRHSAICSGIVAYERVERPKSLVQNAHTDSSGYQGDKASASPFPSIFSSLSPPARYKHRPTCRRRLSRQISHLTAYPRACRLLPRT